MFLNYVLPLRKCFADGVILQQCEIKIPAGNKYIYKENQSHAVDLVFYQFFTEARATRIALPSSMTDIA